MNLYLVDTEYVVAPDEQTAVQAVAEHMMYATVEAAREDGMCEDVELLDPARTLLWDNDDGLGANEVSVATLIAEAGDKVTIVGSTEVG